MRLSGNPHLQGCWLYRAVRGARPDRNPLRRGTDRLETYLLAGLFAAVAAGTPFAAQAASHSAYASALRAQQEQLATTHLVRAVLTQDAAPASGYALNVNVLTPATWTSVTGKHRSGMVPAEPGSLKGVAVSVWADDGSGYLESPPLSASEVAGQADAAVAGAFAGIAAVLVAGTGAIRQLMHRRRMAAWEADWLATAPTWNRQSW